MSKTTRKISDEIRVQVQELKNNGYTLIEIAKELNISLSSVKRFKAQSSNDKVQNQIEDNEVQVGSWKFKFKIQKCV